MFEHCGVRLQQDINGRDRILLRTRRFHMSEERCQGDGEH
jgi:hypothetical protein